MQVCTVQSTSWYKPWPRFNSDNCLDCFGNFHVCLGKTSYKTCTTESNGCRYPNGEILNCPSGYVCTDKQTNPCIRIPTKPSGPFIYSKPKPCHCIGEIQPDPTDCRKFFVCVSDGDKIKKISKACLINQKYDPIQQICTDNFDCGTAISPPSPSCNCQHSGVTDPKSENGLIYCVRERKELLALRHLDCEQPHFVFDKTTQMCKFDDNYKPPSTCENPNNVADCKTDCINENEKKIKNKPLTGNSNCQKTGVFPDLLDCNKYHICRRNCECKEGKCIFEKEIHNCKPGFKFDPLTLSCTNDERVKCLCTARDFKLNCEKEGLFVDDNCPHKYFQCTSVGIDSYLPIIRTCPGTLIFDENSGMCMEKKANHGKKHEEKKEKKHGGKNISDD